MIDNISPNINNQANITNNKYIIMSPSSSNEEAKNDSFETSSNTDTATVPTELQPKKKSKKNLIAALSLGGAVAITLVGTFFKSGLAKNFNKAIREFAEKHSGDLDFTKAKKAMADQKPTMHKISNLMNNFTNCKDSIMKPIWDKIPGLRWMSRKSSEVYEKSGVTMVKNAYTRAQKSMKSFDSLVKDIADKLNDTSAKNRIQELLAQKGKIAAETFSPDKVRIEEIKKLMNEVEDGGIMQNTRNKFINILKNCLKDKSIKGLTSEFVAENTLATRKQTFIKPLREARNAISDIDDEILKILKEHGGEDYLNNKFTVVTSNRLNSLKSLNKAIRMEANDLFDKIRDILIGCAPTDIAGIAMTGGLMGVYMAQADTKEQKVDVALTSGVPLGLGLIATSITTIAMMTGMKPLLVGMGTTLIANNIGKGLSNKYKEKHHLQDEKPSIPTLESTVGEFNQKVTKKVKKHAENLKA